MSEKPIRHEIAILEKVFKWGSVDKMNKVFLSTAITGQIIEFDTTDLTCENKICFV